MMKIFDRVIGEDIKLRVNAAGYDMIVKADKNQIEQALMNLVTNARDAMPHGGTLTISTEEMEIDEGFILMNLFGEPGRYAVIAITDTGLGMDEKTKENIFEPFFTTKEVGKGTGLGLAMVYGTIRQHGGFINVYSSPGQGTTFRIYLPLVKGAVQSVEEEAASAFSKGNETVLLVEDDEAVRNSTKALLEISGYTVMEAADGEHAVRLFRQHRDAIQLVISDIIMPGQSGRDVYEELKKIKSGLKALFISGYPADMLTRKGILADGVNFISKPLRPEALLEKVREILDKHGAQ
jgi:CheY-like chemotaxis protein